MLPRDYGRKTAFHDYMSEKQMSHEDAKMFYQHHLNGKLQNLPGHNRGASPVMRAQTFPSTGGLSRTGSVASHISGRSHARPLGFASYDKPVDSAEIQDPGIGKFDPHESVVAHAPSSAGHHHHHQRPAVVTDGFGSRQSRWLCFERCEDH